MSIVHQARVPSFRWTGRHVRIDPPIWTGLGGIVWMMVCVWISIHLGLFMTVAGVAPAIHRGVSYELPSRRMTSTDVVRLASGQPIVDSRGAVLIDPSVDRIEIRTVDGEGGTRLRFGAGPAEGRAVVILVPSSATSYRATVTALDRTRVERGVGRAPLVWIAPELAVAEAVP